MYVNRLGLCLTVLGGVVLLIAAAYLITYIRRNVMLLNQDTEQLLELLNKAKAKNFVNAKDHAALSKMVKESKGIQAAEWLVWPVDPEHPEWGGISFSDMPGFEFWPYTYACSGHLGNTITHHGPEAHVKHVSWEPKIDLPCIWCVNHPEEIDE